MLDNLFNSVKDQVISGLVEKTGLNVGQAEKAVPMAKESITDGLMGAVKGGNVSGIMDMFSGGGNFAQNAIYQNIAGNFITKLTGKLGIPESMASAVSSFALPMIMKKLQGEASTSGGDVDQNKLMGMLGMDSDSVMDNVKDQAIDAVKDKLGGIGKLFG